MTRATKKLWHASDRDILVMWDDGAPIAAIADALGLGETHVETVIAELGVRSEHVPLARWIGSEIWEDQAA